MRFPIRYERTKWGIKYEDTSQALKESLMDMDIINSHTHEPRQDHFDLQIEEGPLLSNLSSYFDLIGNFHVGCTADVRPPNFNFTQSKGNPMTEEGHFFVSYWRNVQTIPFFENASFRNERGVRDLDKLSEGFNRRDDCDERVLVGWRGSVRGHGSQGEAIYLDFEGPLFVDIHGLDELGKKTEMDSHALYDFGRDTKMLEIAQNYVQEGGWGEFKQYVPSKDFYESGFKMHEALYGLLEIACKIFPPKRPLEPEESLVQVCSSYTPGERRPVIIVDK